MEGRFSRTTAKEQGRRVRLRRVSLCTKTAAVNKNLQPKCSARPRASWLCDNKDARRGAFDVFCCCRIPADEFGHQLGVSAKSAEPPGAELRTSSVKVKSVIEKFREKYGAKDVKKYYLKFDVA